MSRVVVGSVWRERATGRVVRVVEHTPQDFGRSAHVRNEATARLTWIQAWVLEARWRRLGGECAA